MNDEHKRSQPSSRRREVAGYFLRLGCTAFGGPAAHIAMMREEVVRRRQWVSEARFVDLMGIANLIPGPTSTELAIYLGYLRAGWPGLVLAGVCFITPAMLLVLACAWLYVHYHALPQLSWLFYGIQPVVIAIIAQAVWTLSRTVVKSIPALVLAVLVLALYLRGVNVPLLLFGGALLYASFRWPRGMPLTAVSGGWRRFVPLGRVSVAGVVAPVSLLTLFLTFLKFGAIIYGSGYVLLAFLRADLVQHLGWLSDHQLLDAIAVGQFTPGPVFTTATFIGYVLGGFPGAVLATLGIFLPSFLFIALVHPLAARLRQSPLTAVLLDGVNIAALALMAGVLYQLSGHALIDLLTWSVALAALFVLMRYRINSVWLLLAGAVIGVVRFRLQR